MIILRITKKGEPLSILLEMPQDEVDMTLYERDICRRCGAAMTSPLSPGGAGKPVDLPKCPQCGWIVIYAS